MLSELYRPKGRDDVRQAVAAIDSDDLFVSVVSIGEITKGIALLKGSRKKRQLQSWLQTLEQEYADRILGIDIDTSRIWGEITAVAQRAGRIVPASDGLIAASARRHGLQLMTRNVEDFAPTGVLLVNPWSA